MSIIAQLISQQSNQNLQNMQQLAEHWRTTAADPSLDDATREYASRELNKLAVKQDSHKDKHPQTVKDGVAHSDIIRNYLAGTGNVPEPVAVESHKALTKMMPEHVQESFKHFGEQVFPSQGAQPPAPPPPPRLLMKPGSAASPSAALSSTMPPPPSVDAVAPQDPGNAFGDVTGAQAAGPAGVAASAPALEPPPQAQAAPPIPTSITAPNVSATASMPPAQVGSAPSAGFGIAPNPTPNPTPNPGPALPTPPGYSFRPISAEELGRRKLAELQPSADYKEAEAAKLLASQREYLLKAGLTPLQAENVINKHAAVAATQHIGRPGDVLWDEHGNTIGTSEARIASTAPGAVSTLVPSATATPAGGAPSLPTPPSSNVIAAPPALKTPTLRDAIDFYASKMGVKPEDVPASDHPKALREFNQAALTDNQLRAADDAHNSSESRQETQELSRKRIEGILNKSKDTGTPVSDAHVNYIAAQDAITGKTSMTYSSLGRGPEAQATLAKYWNARAAASENQGLSAESVVQKQAAVKNAIGALGALEKQTTLVEGFANNADRNFQLALKLSDKVNRTGSPVINRWLLKLKGEYAGDEDTKNLEAGLSTAATDWAKVSTGQTTGQAVTDAAKRNQDRLSERGAFR